MITIFTFFIITNFKTERYLNNFQEHLVGILRLRKYQTSLQIFFARENEAVNPINTGLLALELTLQRGGVFHPPSITPLSLKLDCSNFAQSYFQIG